MNIKKLWERVNIKEELRKIKFQIWKIKFEEYTSFEVEEDKKKFIISLNFRRKTEIMLKKEISSFLQKCLKKEEIDILTTLELAKRIFNVGVETEGEENTKLLLFFID